MGASVLSAGQVHPAKTEEQSYSSDEAGETVSAHVPKRRARAKARATRPDMRPSHRAAPSQASIAADVAAVVQNVLGFAVSPDQVTST